MPEAGSSNRLRTRGISEETPPPRESCFRWVLAGIPGEDYQREGLVATPRRAAEALAEFTTGYAADIDALFTTFDSDGYDGIVTVRDIPVYSLCEHHLLPFVGRAHIAYIPDKRIIGLSKIARIVNVFARRLQVQERLTGEIADAIEKYLAPAGLSVAVEAEHLCMTVRGVHAQGTMTRTHVSRGSIRDYHVELCGPAQGGPARGAEHIR
ncbi:GTP cyclohydrolase I FolE [Pseudonocardia sp. ICBG1293]|uniref:GTP cyclohydrolase I FolE n=1 Tax=Pseudonocardia sp. ICBG1293 TaxID=2844382 RepID=UPI001CCFFDC5|nr:GTP cyclohydrolase I FolE [Pseudonocardia sp. ICBG1293]